MRAHLIAAALALLPLTGAGAATAPEPPDFVVIVNVDNPSSSADDRFVANAFLKKVTRWPGGDKIRPVDLAPDARARERFSDRVLDRSVPAVKSYWQQIIFTGRGVPPPELESDEAVIQYVQRYPGAVGYVSGGSDLSGVKILELR